jgi:hypothetical protein
MKKLVITLCGSLKFQDIFNDVQMLLERDGHCCFSVGFSEKNYTPPTSFEKEILDKVHYKKIMLSDAILVIDKDEYIGDSTRNEIVFARVTNKDVYMLTQTGYFESKENLIECLNTIEDYEDTI